jgi:carbamoyl-phosphate synthase small subunit
MLPNYPLATLALADGSLFHGYAIGHVGHSIGEVVFNTSMTGYQEILTDPSYSNQIITFTYPHIGNTGVNIEDIEANKIYASALIIRNLPVLHSNFRANNTLEEYLKQNKIVAIAGIDTRKLTKILRATGSQNGAIVVNNKEQNKEQNEQNAISLAKGFSGLLNIDLAKEVTTDKTYQWNTNEWVLKNGYTEQNNDNTYKHHVVVYDFGVKLNILRMLASRACKVTVVQAQTSAEEVMSMNPSGVLLSNGPGDPSACNYAITATKELVSQNIPVFGICLGHQILSLALGANTLKMKFGHHGANHPVKNLLTGKVAITSQNHGFAVDSSTLPNNLRATHVSLFDNSLQGFEHTELPAFGFQGHPEASPGPHDLADLFDKFVNMMNK